MEPPEIRYAQSGDVSIAYSVIGDGPFDVVFVSGWVLSNLAGAWEGTAAELYRGMADFCRLIIFDKRGTGLSDRVTGIPDLETRMDDVRAVMDAAGSRRAAVVGFSEGGPMSILFASSHPERTAAIVLYGSLPSWHKGNDYPWGQTREEMLARFERTNSQIGTDAWLDDALEGLAPTTASDPEAVRLWRRWVRLSASPGTVKAVRRMNMEIDVRDVLSAIRVPTLILHRVGDEDTVIDIAHYMAERIPAAELVELEGIDHGWWVNPLQIVDKLRPFLTGLWQRGEWELVDSERVLATVLFTDIVGSTEKLSEMGDRAWADLIKSHHSFIRRQLLRFSGSEIDTAGDGFFARFDGPARAIRCACAIADGVQEMGLEIRAGLHTGECELLDGKVGGIAVHIGARVVHEAKPGEVLVSSTVRDLVAGSGIRFQERGATELKGLLGEYRLYAVDRELAMAGAGQ